MHKKIDRTLMRLAILKVLLRCNDTERPIRTYQEGDGRKIGELVIRMRKLYAEGIILMREHNRAGTPDFQKLKSDVLGEEAQKREWSEKTINFYSSVISTYISLSHHLKPSDLLLTLNDLRQYERLYLKRSV